ncbi:MAG: hypothetical protein OHK93_004917 [Ramalina farinacea]|uniref:Uncharacterized protein n=1 Tax=Ramalina farinacea TaxID=258253 RepID=A0AA43QZI2_9LECA|nr:hypothetical protein [Ramalina farinacea]
MDQNIKGTPGILTNAIRKDPEYRTGPTNRNRLNSCHNVLERIVFLTDGLKMSKRSQKLIQKYEAWTSEHAGENYNIKSPIRYISKHAGWTKDLEHQTKFVKNFSTDACAERRLKRDMGCSLPTDEGMDAKDDRLELAALSPGSKLPDDALSIASTDDSTAKPTLLGLVKDSRRYSYLSGWHVKFMFHIG